VAKMMHFMDGTVVTSGLDIVNTTALSDGTPWVPIC